MDEIIERREGKYLFQFGLSFWFQANSTFQPVDVFGNTLYISSELHTETITCRLSRGQKVVASIDFNVIDDELVSVHYGTWGGIYFDGKPSLVLLRQWWGWIETTAKLNSLKALKIKLPPTALDDNRVTRNLSVLDGFSGFSETRDYSFVSVPCSRLEFISKMDPGHRKKLNQLSKSGAEINFDRTPQFLKKCHEVIRINRASKSIPLSLNWERLLYIIQRHPDFWFGGIVELDTVAIAAGLFLKINNTSIYVSMWGELPEYKTLSPVATLAVELNDFCIQERIELIDAGTATDKGELNPGLWRFKSNLGFRETAKLTFEKALL